MGEGGEEEEEQRGELTQDRLQRLVLADYIHDARGVFWPDRRHRWRNPGLGRRSGTHHDEYGSDTGAGDTSESTASRPKASRTERHHVHCHLRCVALPPPRGRGTRRSWWRRERGRSNKQQRRTHVITLATGHLSQLLVRDGPRKGRPLAERKRYDGGVLSLKVKHL